MGNGDGLDLSPLFKALARDPYCWTPDQIGRLTMEQVAFYWRLMADDEDEERPTQADAVRGVAGFWEDVAQEAKRRGVPPQAFWEQVRAEAAGAGRDAAAVFKERYWSGSPGE